ncbi:glycoside hydrolase family 65 protein [Rhizomicrobium electricum]|uniref:Glycosyl hydrolase family 65 protein n=1 Tax=Rhizomicrobium electricum TaxID=480070 RepID=A0ABN1EJ77_9PROT|nr:glycoside hydrolase family 65 protein [Rhizomicrobium electricum]NIJ48299.1 kojibiose phosphorylase [Rhizomicrobium electricum]
MTDPWTVETRELAHDRETVMRHGNIYQIANGHMGYRGTLDEYGPDELVAVTLAGVFDQVGEAWREPVNAPNGGYTRIRVDGTPVSALSRPVTSHRQTLSLKNASFERETAFDLGGTAITISSRRFLSAVRPNLGVVRYSVTVSRAATIDIETGIDGDIWDLNGPHILGLVCEKRGETLLVRGRTNEAGKDVVVAEAAAFGFGEERSVRDGKRNLRVVAFAAEPGKTYTFFKVFAVATGFDAIEGSAADAAVAAVTAAKAQGLLVLEAEHDAAWADKWAKSDVVIDGDEVSQHALRYSIFQLLIAAPVDGSANSIPARALSGQVYKGAVFWDTEMFMFPFFLHTSPEKAAELLRYRIRTLPGARRKALTEGAGFRGAFYAWESQETGDDACTYFNIGDPLTKRELRTHFRDKQVHISGDVAMAMWEYFKVTGDDSVLLDGGAEVILECARFYYSYAYFKKDKNRYEVLDVIGPDEYHERVNNNAFTNMVAKATFEIACAAVAYLAERHAGALAALVKKIGIAKELPLFAEASRLLYVPEPDPETRLIEQFDGYFNLKDVPVEAVKAQRIHPDEYLGAGQGLAVPTQVIKQADVVMMLNLFKDRFGRDVKKANWDYYEPRTEHGSSLSACAYAMVAAECGDLDFAYKYFLKTAKLDLEAQYKVYVGTVFMGGSHPAANGGAWMTAVFGFGGVATGPEHVAINPRLYPGWKSLAFRLAYKGDGFAVHITHDAVTIAAEAANRQAHCFVVWGRPVSVAPGKTVLVDRIVKVA